MRGEPWSTSGNQKWNGTSPTFTAIAEVRTRQDVGWVSWEISHCSSVSCIAHAGEQDKGTSSCWGQEVLSGSFNGLWVVGF